MTKAAIETKTEETQAAIEFRSRKDESDNQIDSRKFETWYHVDDVQRIVRTQYMKLAAEQKDKKDKTQLPQVLIDGLDENIAVHSLDLVMERLVNRLKNSKERYLPFIFKPETGAVHYVAGFLRKDKNDTIQLVLFNPTGTFPRINYGSWGNPAFRLETPGIKTDAGFIDFQISGNTLNYAFMMGTGAVKRNSFSAAELQAAGITINDALKDKLIAAPQSAEAYKILKLISDRQEMKPPILSSPHTIQTGDKDGGRLVSCGPLCIKFVEYLINNPDYMETLDYDFALPKFLQEILDGDNYKKAISNIRDEHYKVLNGVQDDDLELIAGIYGVTTSDILEAIPTQGARKRVEDEVDEDDTELLTAEQLAKLDDEDAGVVVESETESESESDKELATRAASEKTAIDKIMQAANNLAENVDQLLEEADKVVDEADKVVDEADKVMEVANKVVENVAQVLEVANQVVEEAEKAKEGAEKAKEGAEKARETAEKAKEAVEKAREAATDTVMEATKKFKEAAEKFKEAAEKVKEAVEKVKEAAEKAKEAMKKLTEAVEKAKAAAKRKPEEPTPRPSNEKHNEKHIENETIFKKEVLEKLLNKNKEQITKQKDLAHDNADSTILTSKINAGQALYTALEAAGAIYFQAPPTEASSKAFQKACDTALADAHKVLDLHTDWYELLANIGIAIATLGIGLLIKGAVNIAKGQSFFSVYQTDSNKKLTEIEETTTNIVKPKL